ncbi:MAG: CcmD family protein [Polyangiales bacterium]
MQALLAALLLGCTWFVIPTASAQDGAAGSEVSSETGETPAEERATQFVGVTGPEAENIPGGGLLLAAYAVVWILIFLYLLRMRGLQRQTAEELERLSAELRASKED